MNSHTSVAIGWDACQTVPGASWGPPLVANLRHVGEVRAVLNGLIGRHANITSVIVHKNYRLCLALSTFAPI